MTLTALHQETSIRDLGIEFDKLESTEKVDSAQAATATSYEDWLDIESVDVIVQKDLSYLLSSDRTRKKKLEYEEAQKSQKSQKSFIVYYERGDLRKSDVPTSQSDAAFPDLAYRRTVHQQQKSREEFLNSIPDRIQVNPVPFVWALID